MGSLGKIGGIGGGKEVCIEGVSGGEGARRGVRHRGGANRVGGAGEAAPQRHWIHSSLSQDLAAVDKPWVFRDSRTDRGPFCRQPALHHKNRLSREPAGSRFGLRLSRMRRLGKISARADAVFMVGTQFSLP
ncbi:hypothetical protein E2C01_050506 [Portunus trituberculatus]|uniref:Uncharacterized protein n=1 Tax=Portunus trituberculatus TaxID=210409 RepID=A0A5B7GJ57_PORTR|nr:hypothetical protein [Portunus trituberculatus]